MDLQEALSYRPVGEKDQKKRSSSFFFLFLKQADKENFKERKHSKAVVHIQNTTAATPFS